MSFLTPAGIPLLYRNLEALEKGLNWFGYIPVVGSFTGSSGRGTLATAEVVAGLALCFFYLFCSIGNPLASFYGITAVVLLKHGILNGIRSSIETYPFASLMICLPFDILVGRVFSYPI